MSMRIFGVLAVSAFLVACGAKEQQVQTTGTDTVAKAASAQDPSPALTKTVRDAMTPDAVLNGLKAGNERFLNRTPLYRDYADQIADTSAGQFPSAVILSCIDSRIPTEVVLDQGIGDVFNARVAGNIVNAEILGSMEFATAVAGAKLVVVMGHTACGAVKGACDNVDLGNVTSLVTNIRPSVEAVAGQSCTSSDSSMVDKVASHNVERTIDEIRKQSQIMTDLESQGKIKIVGAMYDISNGKVTFM